MKSTLQDCLRLRAHYMPFAKIAGGLECISYPFPKPDGGIGIMVRKMDNPLSIREVAIPESDWLKDPRVRLVDYLAELYGDKQMGEHLTEAVLDEYRRHGMRQDVLLDFLRTNETSLRAGERQKIAGLVAECFGPRLAFNDLVENEHSRDNSRLGGAR